LITTYIIFTPAPNQKKIISHPLFYKFSIPLDHPTSLFQDPNSPFADTRAVRGDLNS